MIKKSIVGLSILVTIVNLADVPYNRPVFEKMLSGDSFRQLADFILESNCPWEIKNYRGNLKPENVTPGDIVFVETCGLELFFQDYYPKINSPFILITHNHDSSAPRQLANYLDDPKIIKWFTFNPTITHEKLIPLPLGLSNRGYNHSSLHENIINKVLSQNKATEKNIFLYINFDWQTAPLIRKPIWDYFGKLTLTNFGKKIVFPKSRKPFEQFIKDLSNSRFTISPQGSGMDCHRVWEALYVGCIPVVKSSSLDQLYSNFPVIIVQRWEQVSEEFLLQKEAELKNKNFNIEMLYIDYWKNKVLELKRQSKSHTTA